MGDKTRVTAEDLLDWLCHPSGRATKLARLDQLLRAEREVALVREVMREVVIELEQVSDDDAQTA